MDPSEHPGGEDATDPLAERADADRSQDVPAADTLSPDAVSVVRPVAKRPVTPPVAGILAVLAAVAACLVLVCTAGAFGSFQAAIKGEQRKTQRHIERLAQGLEQEAALAATLDGLEAFLLSLHADAFSFPEELPELAPNDPWGNPIRYVRLDADRAILESDGPDRRRDSGDDVSRAVDAR